MNILFLTDNFPPEVNAPANRTFEHVREWVKLGHSVTVITCAPNFPRGILFPGYSNKFLSSEVIDGVKVLRVWSFISPNEGFLLRLLDHVSFMFFSFIIGVFVKRIDIVIGTSPQFFTICSSYFIGLIRKVPVVHEIRDLWTESLEAVSMVKNTLVIKILHSLEFFLYKNAFCLIVVTSAFKKRLIDCGIKPESICVITNGINPLIFYPREKNQILIKNHQLEGKFVVGYIGTIGLAHGLETLLEAAFNLKMQRNIVFLLIGDGAQRKFILDKINSMELDNIICLETVYSREKIASYWSILDLSIIHLKKLPAFSKVIPSKLFEAIGSGVPVLHGVIGESAEIVLKESVGELFEPENSKELASKILNFYENPSLLSFYKKKSIIVSHKYNRYSLAKKMIEFIIKKMKKCQA